MVEQKLFNKIYSNYLETGYLNIYSLVKDKKIAIEIIKKSLDRIFLFDYKYFDLSDFSLRLRKYISQYVKQYKVIEEKELIIEDFLVPTSILNLSSNLDRILNEIDNLLIINYIIYNKDIKELSLLFNLSEEYIVNKFSFVFRHIRNNYKENIREELEKTISCYC